MPHLRLSFSIFSLMQIKPNSLPSCRFCGIFQNSSTQYRVIQATENYDSVLTLMHFTIYVLLCVLYQYFVQTALSGTSV